MDSAQLRVKIEQAKRRLLSAEQAMQTALQVVEPAAKADKAMISNALRAALDELRSAKQEVFDLERQIGPEVGGVGRGHDRILAHWATSQSWGVRR